VKVIDAMKARISTRAFLDKPVSHEQIDTILDAARWSPSDKNIQPWHVAVVTGETKSRLSSVFSVLAQDKANWKPDYTVTELQGIYKDRAFTCGVDLYKALDINRDDKPRRREQWELNYQFFGAPVGLLFFLQNDVELDAWTDIGMFIENVMLAAMELGLATCPQRSISYFPDAIRETLGEPFQNKLLVTGMALGYPDTDHPVNNYRTQREAVNDFTTWFD
tara:strand:+ start:114468 stop:115130 length:663 start_codon:yes stop_codon:yes gene_type:complete